MATTLSTTRDNIIEAALRRLRVLASGGSGSANQLSDGAQALNFILKQLEQDPNVAFNLDVAWTGGTSIAAGATSINLGTADITAVAAYYIDDATSTRNELISISWEKFLATSDSTGASQDTPKYFVCTTDQSQANVKLFVTPAPSAAGNIFHWAKKRLDLFDNASDTSDIPDAWERYLVLQLTADLAREYGKRLEEWDRHDKDAEKAYATLIQFEADQARQTFLHKPDVVSTGQKG